MNRKYTNRRYLDALEKKVLVFDGAMGTSLQNQNLTAEHFGGEQYNGCNDYLVISYPEAVEKVHRSFLEVGVDVLETDTFRSNRITMAEYGLQDRVIEINETAARLARRLADEYSNKDTSYTVQDSVSRNSYPVSPHPRFVAGSIGPSGKLPSANDPDLSNVTFDELVEVFREQAVGLIRGGVDVLLIETSQDILEVKAAIIGLHKAMDETQVHLPIQAQVTLDTTGRMLLGTDINASLAILEGMGIDVIGLNCSTGPEHMREPIRILGENSTLPVSCIPNAGLPLNVDGQAVYPLEPEPFANDLYEFVTKHKISIVGGCCGTTPAHLKLLVDKLRDTPHAPRPLHSTPQLASAMSALSMRQEPPPTLLGERCNAQGSRKFKRMLLEEDYDGILGIAREQVDGGAHALDISCAVTERPDEAELMRKVVKKLEMGVDVPLVIDSTELDVLEIALKTAPGRCLINSTHLEAGRSKADKVFALAKQHNAAVIVLTIDENGMAKTREKKLEVAKRIYDIAVNDHGLKPEDLVYDTLTFTLATGDQEFVESAIETIEGIRLIKQNLPGVMASLGVSNLSFGFAQHARPVLNSVMLYHCVQAGLDMAIVNPTHVTPYPDISQEEKDLAEDLIFNRRADALQRYIEHYENVTPSAESALADPTADMTPEQRLHWKIVHRKKDGVEADIDEIIFRQVDTYASTQVESDNASRLTDDVTRNPYPVSPASPHSIRSTQHAIAVHTLNNVLLPAMKEVGDKFGAGELILPFVLQSAEVMKKTVAHLENYLEKKEGVSKGKVVIATVYGDVHDIGKNLVKTILSNNGYDVIDLGKQVPAETIITKAVEADATAIGLSALLVSTSKQMPLIVNELHRRGHNIPVLIGGAAINRRFGRRILQTESGDFYDSGVFYCKDAFEGLETMDVLIDDKKRPDLLAKVRRESEMELGRAVAQSSITNYQLQRSSIQPSPIQHPTKWGVRVVKDMPLEMVFKHLSLNELYRLSWGAKNTHGAEWDKLKAEYDVRLDRMKREAMRAGWLKPQAVYGYFPCQADGDDLLIYDPQSITNIVPVGDYQLPTTNLQSPIARFTFPRQNFDDRLCLADYFAPVASGQVDVVALQVVTVGHAATELIDRLNAQGDYTDSYFTHGLSVQTAEATADYIHTHIRRELGLAADQGKRYSWGYPAIPELEDHRKVFELLPVRQELGMDLTSACQLMPEQSTAAIVVHHKDATYYNVGDSRIEQLMK
ncbi:MAG: methionine synthase [Anaerolineaceae bacterium]|nr:methionine synthase [Anaerolineae bacterium]MDL1925134.1 methionine synthase [Anaerolineae bacterium AMX1]WKZ54399.1 MAG: homocysteine S-methyltransferase family protein [Anaerolineales bacterium]GIK09759.1 MAG: methionine synthase [Chloroflexota bacterium]GJQ38745.1 MAG: methionine synthase [Anaerolineaceae bacterium]